MLTGEIAPDAGTVKLGTNLELAVFDQARATLNPEQDVVGRVGERSRHGGEGQFRSGDGARHAQTCRPPISRISCLTNNRRAAPFARCRGASGRGCCWRGSWRGPSNLLILDEPTNDLDVETLDLLQDLLGEYDGTVLLVSHDRDFIDRVASTTIVMEGDGRATVYAGGWSDYQAQKALSAAAAPASKPAGAARQAPAPEKGRGKRRKPAGSALPNAIASMRCPPRSRGLRARSPSSKPSSPSPICSPAKPAKFKKGSEALVQRQAALAAAEEEWLVLEEKAQAN